jgi:3-hydroxybutyryl-CoA dehydrogenase
MDARPERIGKILDEGKSNVEPMGRRNGAATAKRRARPKLSEVGAGVIGLGLMGTSIVACLLAAGHRVVVVTRNSGNHKRAKRHIIGLLRQMKREGVLEVDPSGLGKQLTITGEFSALRDCGVVIESIVEDVRAKKNVLRRIEAVVPADTVIGSNTSGIPITMLQEGAVHPGRIVGLHWAEPAHITRFMEVIAGDLTDAVSVERALTLARAWRKDPTYVRRDIRGFITNRLMYAMLREAFYLVEHGYATPEDVDRSAQNDMGWWLTFAGPFRFMDLTGIPAYAAVMRDLLPGMCNSSSVPALMKQKVASGAKGVSNARGFYRYTPAEARRWEKAFLAFTYDVRRLASKYSPKSQRYPTNGDPAITLTRSALRR